MPVAEFEQGLAVERYPAVRGSQEPGHGVDDRGLAGAGAAEQRGDAARGREAGAQGEGTQRALDVDLEHQAPRTIRATGRASSSDAIRAANERAIDTSVRRRAPASPPGIWVKV